MRNKKLWRLLAMLICGAMMLNCVAIAEEGIQTYTGADDGGSNENSGDGESGNSGSDPDPNPPSPVQPPNPDPPQNTTPPPVTEPDTTSSTTSAPSQTDTPDPGPVLPPDTGETQGPEHTDTPGTDNTDDPNPGETDTPGNTDDPNPGETDTPGNTDDPNPGETDEPDTTPDPGETDEPDTTPDPGETDEPDTTPDPDDPDNTPDPDETPDPDTTPDPNATPNPDATPGPDATPEPDTTVSADDVPPLTLANADQLAARGLDVDEEIRMGIALSRAVECIVAEYGAYVDVSVRNADKVLTPNEFAALQMLFANERVLVMLEVLDCEAELTNVLEELGIPLSIEAETLIDQIRTRISEMTAEERAEFDELIQEYFTNSEDNLALLIEINTVGDVSAYFERYCFVRNEVGEWVFKELYVLA